MKLVFVVLLFIAPLCGAWAQDGAPGPSTAVATQATELVEYSGKTQLYIDWARPLTLTESAFLATVPENTDSSGQSYRKLIEVCFRAGIAHADSAPRYGWVDGNGVVYDYSYYCRLLQPADAAHIWRLRLVARRLPKLEPPAPSAPADLASLQPAALSGVCLDLMPVTGMDVEVMKPTVPCRLAGGAIERGSSAREIYEPIGAVSIIPERPCQSPDDGTCGPGEPPAPPSPNDPGVVAPPGDPSGQVPCPPESDPNAPPAQEDHGTGGQPWDPGPDHPNVADPVIPEGAPGAPTAP